MRNGSRKLLLNPPCPALRQMHSKLLPDMKEKETGKRGKKNPAGSKNSRLPCRCPDRWWSTPASHLAVPLVGTHACRYAASESPPTPLPPLLPQTPPWMDSFANPRKAPQQTPLLAATLSRKAFEKSRRRKPALLQQRESSRSLAPPNDGARETRNKQTRSVALPLARATRRRLPPPPLQPCRPATIQPTVTAAGFSVVNWTVVKWILL